MKYRVRISDQADADLRGIFEYIAYNTNPWLKTPTERQGFFASDEEDGAENTVCIIKPYDEAWRKKDRRELASLTRD